MSVAILEVQKMLLAAGVTSVGISILIALAGFGAAGIVAGKVLLYLSLTQTRSLTRYSFASRVAAIRCLRRSNTSRRFFRLYAIHGDDWGPGLPPSGGFNCWGCYCRSSSVALWETEIVIGRPTAI